MTLPTLLRGGNVQLGESALHHVDIMRVLGFTFICTDIPGAKAGANAVQARSGGGQITLIAQGNLETRELRSARQMRGLTPDRRNR